MFIPFLSVMSKDPSSDELAAFVSEARSELTKGGNEWTFAALQAISRASTKTTELLDLLEDSYIKVRPEFRDRGPNDGDRYFCEGYSHPLHFRQRRILMERGTSPHVLEDIARAEWTLRNQLGATLLVIPGWVILEYWQTAPWKTLQRYAEGRIHELRASLNAQQLAELSGWMQRCWSGWRDNELADRTSAEFFSLQFRAPWLFRV
jgi:hypothetical protein